MCTATWFLRRGGYEFFFNRDERKSRLPAGAPAVRESDDGVRFLAPTDGDHGGSWIAVNERGLSIGLLNRYEVPFDGTRAYRSRGLLVLDLASSRSADEVAGRLGAIDARRYPPFRVVVLAPEEGARVYAWDGAGVSTEDVTQPVVSSSFAGLERVTAVRTAEFAPIAAGPNGRDRSDETAASARARAAHLRFHHSHEEGPSAYSVCMHREDAETRNFTHVIVTADTVTLRQKPDAPCRSHYLPETVLKRV